MPGRAEPRCSPQYLRVVTISILPTRRGEGVVTAGTGPVRPGFRADHAATLAPMPDPEISAPATPSPGFTYRDLHIATTGPEGAPPVVLLHGWGSSAALMRPLAASLEDAFRVYALDMPGHGQSPAPPVAMGVPESADLVVDFIESEIGEAVPLVGHSNGGRISLHIASHPDLKRHASRLALISPSGITPPRSAKYHVKKTTARVLKAPFEILPGPMREFGLDWLRHSLVWKALGSSDYRALDGTMRGTFVKTVGFHLDDRVRDISVPTLLFWGDEDTAVVREQMETLEREIPDAGLVVLEGAGHYGYLDAPEIVEAGLRAFLEDGVAERAGAVPRAAR